MERILWVTYRTPSSPPECNSRSISIIKTPRAKRDWTSSWYACTNPRGNGIWRNFNNAFPSRSLFAGRQRVASVLNNNGIAQVGLLENICPFPRPRPAFCRDSFGLPHNDASRLWNSHSRIHEGEKGRPPCSVASPRLASPRLPSFPFPAV